MNTCFVRLQIELFDLMKKNGFLCKCIIIVLPTAVFPLSVSFSNRFRNRVWLKSGEEAGYTSGSVSYFVKVCTRLSLSVVNWLSKE